MAAASATTSLRVGSYVHNNDFRNPALLAKEAATIDVLSGGRMELGLGAGYRKAEYDAVGLTFDPPGVRVSRREEAVDIVTRLLDGEKVDFEGQHYHLAGYGDIPAPVQRPLPLLIGGSGQRMLRLAARKAQIVGLLPGSGELAPAAMDAKIALLESAIAEAGRSDGGPERNLPFFGVSSDMDTLLRERGDGWRFRSVPRELLAATPFVLVGDDAAQAEALHERHQRWGFTYFVCYSDQLDKFIPVVRRLAR
jgi:probable F420-dependent oxidoreductase